MPSRRARAFACVGLLALQSALYAEAQVSPAPTRQFVPSRQIVLGFCPIDQSPITAARLWLRRPDEPAWREVSDLQLGSRAVTFAAPSDGAYQLYLVLENTAGASAPAPQRGSRPHTEVVVDTAAPLLQIREARLTRLAAERGRLELTLKLVEENLGLHGVAAFVRTTAGDAWTHVRLRSESLEHWSGEIALESPGPLDVRLVVTDLAGNQARDEAVARLEVDFAASQPTSMPATAPAVPGTSDAARPWALDHEPEPGLAQPNPARQLHVLRLEKLAQEDIRTGQATLAVARLRDALTRAPSDGRLQLLLGQALLECRDFAAARPAFQAALDVGADEAAALRGLALVDVAENAYPAARRHLARLLELSPEDSESWLRMGDVEHKLGNRLAARSAWEKVAQATDGPPDVRDRAAKRLSLFD